MVQQWHTKFPAATHPVIALKGAPARYPIAVADRPLQQYMQWAPSLIEMADAFIESSLGGRTDDGQSKYVSLHMRNGVDWENACKHAVGQASYMSSPQCMGPGESVTAELCRPSVAVVVQHLVPILKKNKLRHVFLGTDTPKVRSVRAKTTTQRD